MRVDLVSIEVPEGCQARVVGARGARHSRERIWADRRAFPAEIEVEISGIPVLPGDVDPNGDGPDEPWWSDAFTARLHSMGYSSVLEWPEDFLRPTPPACVTVFCTVPVPGSEKEYQNLIDRAKEARNAKLRRKRSSRSPSRG